METEVGRGLLANLYRCKRAVNHLRKYVAKNCKIVRKNNPHLRGRASLGLELNFSLENVRVIMLEMPKLERELESLKEYLTLKERYEKPGKYLSAFMTKAIMLWKWLNGGAYYGTDGEITKETLKTSLRENKRYTLGRQNLLDEIIAKSQYWEKFYFSVRDILNTEIERNRKLNATYLSNRFLLQKV